MVKPPKLNTKDLSGEVSALIENANVLEPTMSPVVLAERILTEADPDLIADVGRQVLTDYFARLIRAERRKKIGIRPRQLALFEHLPLRIAGERDRRISLAKATYADIRRYCKLLRRQHSDKKKNDARLKEAEMLLERMKAASKEKRGITVGEVLGFDFD